MLCGFETRRFHLQNYLSERWTCENSCVEEKSWRGRGKSAHTSKVNSFATRKQQFSLSQERRAHNVYQFMGKIFIKTPNISLSLSFNPALHHTVCDISLSGSGQLSLFCPLPTTCVPSSSLTGRIVQKDEKQNCPWLSTALLSNN